MYGNTCRTLSIKVLFEKKWVSSQKKTKKKKTMVIKEELFTCIHVCLQVIQHKWIKNISNDFPCISFLQISRRSNDFFNEAKRRQKILLLILIVSTHIAYVFKIWALPVFGWLNECIIFYFFIFIRFRYSSMWFNRRRIET